MQLLIRAPEWFERGFELQTKARGCGVLTLCRFGGGRDSPGSAPCAHRGSPAAVSESRGCCWWCKYFKFLLKTPRRDPVGMRGGEIRILSSPRCLLQLAGREGLVAGRAPCSKRHSNHFNPLVINKINKINNPSLWAGRTCNPAPNPSLPCPLGGHKATRSPQSPPVWGCASQGLQAPLPPSCSPPALARAGLPAAPSSGASFCHGSQMSRGRTCTERPWLVPRSCRTGDGDSRGQRRMEARGPSVTPAGVAGCGPMGARAALRGETAARGHEKPELFNKG